MHQRQQRSGARPALGPQGADLLNIDVSAELGGYWADNGGSCVRGADLHRHRPLVYASRQLLHTAFGRIHGGHRHPGVGAW